MRPPRALLVLAFGLAACGQPAPLPSPEGKDAGGGGGASDAGPEADAGTPTDAGGSTDAGTSIAPDAGAPLGGALVGGTGAWPGPIEGVRYRTATQAGVTDAAGGFRYLAGEIVTFSVADVDFRPAPGAAHVTPYQLAAQGKCSQSAELERLLLLLDSLDADGDPTNGLKVVAAPPGATQRSSSALTDADAAALIGQLIAGRSPVATATTVHAFITQLDGELWKQLGQDTFNGSSAASRSQGVTTDGASWFFSWRLGLEKTDLGYATQKSNSLAIPLTLAAQGCNHIGDVDWANGTLWAPIEDGSSYQHPNLVEYDANLNAGARHALPTTVLTKGVPWVAADAPRASLYVAEWDPTPAVFIFSMPGVSQTGTLQLSTPVGRIQGGKVFEGALYLSSDNAAKSVYKVNLETGTVIELFALNLTGEMEGLAFLARPDGSLMHTLNANSGATAMEFRHHQRTRPPLRKEVCP